MQIVIDIVDDDYNRINSYPDGKTFYPITARLYKAVKEGIPLPKLGKIYVELNEAQIEGAPEYKGIGVAKQMICDVKTIVEAKNET